MVSTPPFTPSPSVAATNNVSHRHRKPAVLTPRIASAQHHQPLRQSPARVRRVRGCLVGNRGALRPQEAVRPPRGPLRVLRDLTAPGVALRHPRHGDLCPAASFGVPLGPLRASRFGLEPFGRSPARRPLLVLCRKRSQRASWSLSHPSFPSRRRSLAREGRMRISRPVATSNARIITRRRQRGDKGCC